MSDAKQQGEGSSEGVAPPDSGHGAPKRAKSLSDWIEGEVLRLLPDDLVVTPDGVMSPGRLRIRVATFAHRIADRAPGARASVEADDHDRCAFCGQILPKAVSPQAWAKMLRDLAALPGGDPEIAALVRAKADEIDPPLPVPDAAWRMVIAEIRAAMPFWAPDVIAERIGRYVKAHGEPVRQALYKELTVEQRAALGLGAP